MGGINLPDGFFLELLDLLGAPGDLCYRVPQEDIELF
jgi:hypothetical protein